MVSFLCSHRSHLQPSQALAAIAAMPGPPNSTGPDPEPPVAGRVPVNESWAASWQVQGDRPLHWIDYDQAFCERLEAAFHNGFSAFQWAPRGTVVFEYDTRELTQTNLETNGRRIMRRILVEIRDVDLLPNRLRTAEVWNMENWTRDQLNRRRGRSSSGSRTRSTSRARR